MIIKIIPEAGESFKKTEHKGIKEFFIFGNKADEDSQLVDFHDWKGSYRFLIGSLEYFKTTIAEEYKTKSKTPQSKNEIDFKPRIIPVPANIPAQEPQIENKMPETVIDATGIEFPPLKPTIQEEVPTGN